MSLHDELQRIAETAPVAEVRADTWARARRARTRDRGLVLAAAVAVVALVAGVGTWQRVSAPPVAAGTGTVPDHVYAPPSQQAVALAPDLAVGRASVAFLSDFGTSTRAVVVGARDGRYHRLDLPRLAVRDGSSAAEPQPIALSPDGTQLAWSFAGRPPRRAGEPVSTGIGVTDLRSGTTRTVPFPRAHGILVRTVSWSPDSRWLVWDGQVSTRWTAREARFGDEMAAGRIAPGSTTSQPVPAGPASSFQAYAVDDEGAVTIATTRGLLRWDGTGRRLAGVPASAGHPLSVSSAAGSVTRVGATEGRDAQVTWARLGTTGWQLARTDVGSDLLTVRGWRGRVAVVETDPGSGDEPTGHLGLLSPPRGAGGTASYEPVGVVDSGVAALSVATDLMTPDHPTATMPVPDWAQQPGTSPWVWALAATALLLALVTLLLLRRRPVVEMGLVRR